LRRIPARERPPPHLNAEAAGTCLSGRAHVKRRAARRGAAGIAIVNAYRRDY